MSRVSWDDYFLGIAREVANRATCPRLSVGAVFVRDHDIIATGYNGAVRKAAHCTTAGCLMRDGHCVRANHAEANAIARSAKRGVCVDGATAYVTHLPCWPCFRLMVNAGIVRVVYGEEYRMDPLMAHTATDLGITVTRGGA
jgi:dCMP deaminase